MNRKIASYLGFARKAGKVMSGVNTCTFGIGKGKIELVILAEDISDNSKKTGALHNTRHSTGTVTDHWTVRKKRHRHMRQRIRGSNIEGIQGS